MGLSCGCGMEEFPLGADVTGVWGLLLYMDVYEGSGGSVGSEF
jgi:hypothetical protein